MRVVKIIGGLILMLVFFGLVNASIYADSQIRDNSLAALGTDEIKSRSNEINMLEDTDEIDIFTYTNYQNHQVSISSSNITLDCKGTGSMALEDQEMVENNAKIKAVFSPTRYGKKSNSLVVEKREKAYIFVTNEYVGVDYPKNQVKCNYSINIDTL